MSSLFGSFRGVGEQQVAAWQLLVGGLLGEDNQESKATATNEKRQGLGEMLGL